MARSRTDSESRTQSRETAARDHWLIPGAMPSPLGRRHVIRPVLTPLRRECMPPYDATKNSARMPARIFQRLIPNNYWQAIHGEFSATNANSMDNLRHRGDWL